MVDLRPRQAFGHDSTIYVLSQLPASATDELFNSLTSASTSIRDTSIVPWHIRNRYYETEVQFSIFDSPTEVHEELKRVKKEIIPALMILVDNSKPIDTQFLNEFDTETIDVPLIVGKSTSSSDPALPWEDMMQQCISRGWEYVDLSDSGEDELGGQSGISRVSEALQAHIWPMDPRMSKPRPQPARISPDSDDESEEAGTSTSHRRPRQDSDASSASDDFEDNFAPFVSAAARDTVLSAAPMSPSLDDTTAPTFPSSSDYPPFDGPGEEDPTSHLADMFASFAGLRERAMDMQDRNQKMDFAEEIALRFAKQLDLLMGDAAEEIPEVQLPDIGRKETESAAALQHSAQSTAGPRATSSIDMPKSEKTTLKEGDDQISVQGTV